MAFLLPQINKGVPKYYFLLNEVDKIYYDTIKSSQREGKKTIDMNFKEELKKLKKFVIRGNSDDWKRGVVCGIYWLPDNKGIATNIRQLKIVLNRCKSSINSSLTRIGSVVALTRGKAANLIVESFPIFKDSPSEIRQWTIRKDFEQDSLDILQDEIVKKNRNDDFIEKFNDFNSQNEDNDFSQFSSNEFCDINENQNIEYSNYEIF